jgi:hypothetical protein
MQLVIRFETPNTGENQHRALWVVKNLLMEREMCFCGQLLMLFDCLFESRPVLGISGIT